MEDPRRIRRAASAAGIVLALLATAPRPAGAEPSANRLRVLVAADEEPEMFSFEPGSAPGLEREMIEGFARLHGMRLEVVPVTNFDQIIPTLRAGQGDVILGIVDTEARRELVGFTDGDRQFRVLDLGRLVSRTYRLDQIQEAYADMLGGGTARGVIVF